MEKDLDIVGLGSPLLDIIVAVDDDMLRYLEFAKSSMNLVDEQQSADILDRLEDHKQTLVAGGSAANALAAASLLGAKTAFMGVVGMDQHGTIYENQTVESGVEPLLEHDREAATGHAITMTTPDHERTFATHLGAAALLGKEHVNEDAVARAKVLHIEAYLLESDGGFDAVMHAAAIAKKNNTLVSVDLSDDGLVERIHGVLSHFVSECDIVFADHAEAQALTEKSEKEALAAIKTLCSCDKAIVKLGERGSLVSWEGEDLEIAPHDVEVANVNGAGDAYAAGFLVSMLKGKSVQKCGDIASHMGALAVASPGARIEKEFHATIDQYKN